MAEQPKARRRNTREELIKAGVEEINRYGVAGFSMRRIAQLCGVSCGAPYKHFGDRKEFIAAIIDDVNAQWHARQAELLAAYEGDTRKQIVEMSTGYVQFLAENPHLRAILTLKDRDFDNVYHRVRGELSSPTQRVRVGLEVTGRGIVREHQDVFLGQEKIGQTTSGTHCPYLGKAVAMALLDAKHAKEGTELEVEVRGRRIGAKIVPLPFYKRG